MMATFDVLVHTSLREGLPQVFVQIRAIGRPIVAFEVEGAHDMIDHGVNGFIVPMKDVDAVAERLTFLITDMDTTRDMGAEGRKKVDESWRVESMVQATDRLYRTLLKEKSNTTDN